MGVTVRNSFSVYSVLLSTIIFLSIVSFSYINEVSAESPTTITRIKTMTFSDVSQNFDQWKTGTGSFNAQDKISAISTNDGNSSFITSTVNNDIQGFVSETTIDNPLSINYVKVVSIGDKPDVSSKTTKFSQGLAMNGIPIALPNGGVGLQPGYQQYVQTFYLNPFSGSNERNQEPWNPEDLPNLEYIVEQNTDAKEVRVTQFYAEVSYEVLAPTITITSSPSEVPWGHKATVSGFVTNVSDGDVITIDWGDGSQDDEIIINGSTNWSVDHFYSGSSVGPNTVTASLTVGTYVTSDSETIDVQKHETKIVDFVTAGEFLTTGSPFSVTGALIDLDNQNSGIKNKNISFSGTGSSDLPSATTGGIVIEAPSSETLEVEPCGYCSIGSGPNIVLLEEGDKIKFDVPVTWATLFFEDNQMKTIQTQALGLAERVDFHDGTIEPGFYVVYGPGVSEITINSISDDSNIGLVRVAASNDEATINIIDEDVTTLTTQTPQILNIGGGTFSSKGVSSLVEGQYDITAQFSEDTLYFGSDASDSFNLEVNQNDNTQLGTGALVNVVADSGTGYIGEVCSTDSDMDSVCLYSEIHGRSFSVWGKTYTIDLPNRGDSVPNIYIEIDYMKDHKPDPTAIQNVIDKFAENGISLTFFVDEEIPHVDMLHIWTDNDSDPTNDFDSIKTKYFGFASERSTATGQTTSISSGSSSSKTLTISNILVSTPPHSPRIIKDPAAGNDLTEGKVIIKSKITTSIPAALSVPSTITKPSPGTGLVIFANPAVSALPISGTEYMLTIQVPFRTTGSLNNVSLGTLSVPITLSSAATATAQTAPNSPVASSTLIQGYAQVVRYMIFGHSSGGPSGTSEFLGNDAAITLGEGFGGTVSGHAGSVGTIVEQSGTMMHEIGHGLGLKHGGPEKIGTTINTDADINCKPNFVSVMSYSRQTSAYLGTKWILDYSHGNLTPLAENSLNELAGFPSSSAQSTWQIFANPLHLIRGGPSYLSGQTPIKINFDGDGVFDASPVSVDLNNFGIPGCNTPQISTTPYNDYDEWSNLNYNFRDTVSGQFDGFGGNHPTPNGDLNSENYQLQILQGFQFPGAKPPPSTDGTEIRNKGSSLPLKIPILDSLGNPIDFAQIYAKYTVGSSTSEKYVEDSSQNTSFSYSGGFYSINWQTPKKAGVYYITAYITNPVGQGNDWSIINEDLEPQLMNPAGKIVTFKVTLE